MIKRWMKDRKKRAVAKLIADAQRAEREEQLTKHGVLLKCLWCRQIGNVQEAADLTPFREDGEDDGRYILTCGCCGGRSVWDFSLAPVPISLSAYMPPVPMEPNARKCNPMG